jgi:hypothetical protein
MPSKDSEARAAIIELDEAGETLTLAWIEESVEKAMIVSARATLSVSPSRDPGDSKACRMTIG